MNAPVTLGIIGAGCIGRSIAKAVADGKLSYRLAAVCDIDKAALDSLLGDYAPDARPYDIHGTLSCCDVVVECAAAGAVAGIVSTAQQVYEQHNRPSHILVMSVGGLLGAPYPEAGGPVVHVPAGALGALDAVQAMAVTGLDEVVLTTRKPPAALGLDVPEETLLFDGPACDVIEKYPKNVNVAMALSLAGIGPHNTRVRLIADPSIDRNTHHVVARGPAGEIEFTSRNMPFPENPRTSYLAALSAIAMLKRLASTLQVG